MTKRISRRLAPAGLFDEMSTAAAAVLVSASVPVASGLSPEQAQRVQRVAAVLQRDTTRLQHQLASPLASWEQHEHQTIEANVALSFTLKAVAEFLPADLQTLIVQFVDLRARLVLREYQEEV